MKSPIGSGIEPPSEPWLDDWYQDLFRKDVERHQERMEDIVRSFLRGNVYDLDIEGEVQGGGGAYFLIHPYPREKGTTESYRVILTNDIPFDARGVLAGVYFVPLELDSRIEIGATRSSVCDISLQGSDYGDPAYTIKNSFCSVAYVTRIVRLNKEGKLTVRVKGGDALVAVYVHGYIK